MTKNESKTSMHQIEKHKIKLRTESAEYERLHEKLESIESRISEMKQNLQKKSEEKEKRQKIKVKMEE